MNIPSKIQSGDAYSFTESLSQYPASAGYSLKYVLVNNSSNIEFTSTAQDDDHLFTLTSSVTSKYDPGNYKAFLFAIKAAERYTVESPQWCEVLINPTSGSFVDFRTANERILDNINSALEAILSDGVVTFTIRDRTTTFTEPSKLLELKKQFENIVAREKAGLDDSFTILAEF